MPFSIRTSGGALVVLALALVCAFGARAAAQTSQPSSAEGLRGYVQPAFLLVFQPSGATAPNRVSGTLSGTAPAVSFAVGAFVGSQVGVEGEVVLVRDLASPQTFSYMSSRTDYLIHGRDTYLNGLVRVRIAPTVELVAGGGITITSTQQTDQIVTSYDYTSGRNVTSSIPDTAVFQVTRWNATAGLDVVVNPRSRVLVVPMLRFRLVDRPGWGSEGWTGAGSYVIQFGVGVRPRF